jgi:cell pole-organizing protein PopZ
MTGRSHEPADRSDEDFFARLRRAAHPGAAVATTEDEPLELTAVVAAVADNAPNVLDAASQTAAPKTLADRFAERAQAAAAPPEGRSVASVLSRLDAREAVLAAARKEGIGVSNRPLDAIVEEVLRPILTDWLDRNLERIVRDQVDAALQAEVAARERSRPPAG